MTSHLTLNTTAGLIGAHPAPSGSCQLQIKGPTLRRWHSKIAVAVDRPFFASLGGPSIQPSQDLDTGDVVWLVPELRDGQLVRGHWEVLILRKHWITFLGIFPSFLKPMRKLLWFLVQEIFTFPGDVVDLDIRFAPNSLGFFR